MAKARVGFGSGWKVRARRNPEPGKGLEMGTGTDCPGGCGASLWGHSQPSCVFCVQVTLPWQWGWTGPSQRALPSLANLPTLLQFWKSWQCNGHRWGSTAWGAVQEGIHGHHGWDVPEEQDRFSTGATVPLVLVPCCNPQSRMY